MRRDAGAVSSLSHASGGCHELLPVWQFTDARALVLVDDRMLKCMAAWSTK
jgi:hypothetical protein